MKKTAYRKDIMRTISRGKKRFCSILVIAALGVVMFTGLRASCVDLRRSADTFMDDQNLYDIVVQSTLGLTDDDVEELSSLDGVSAAEGGFSETVYLSGSDSHARVLIKTISETGMNEPYLVEGTLPAAENEIAVTQGYLNDSGKSIGDTVTIEEIEDDDDDDDADSEGSDDSSGETDASDTDDDADSDDDSIQIDVDIDTSSLEEEDTPTFPNTEFIITAVVTDPADINNPDSGTAFRISSSTDYTFFVTADAVDSDVYTAVYLTVDGASALNCFSDAYSDAIDEVMGLIEDEVKSRREAARTEDVVSEAQETIDDAQQTMNDAFDEADAQILDAQQELADAREELDEGWAEYYDGLAEVEDGWEQLEEGEKTLLEEEESAYEQIAEAREQIEEGKTQIEEGLAEIEESEAALAQSQEELDAAKEELTAQEEASAAQLEEAQQELSDAKETLEDARAQIDAAKETLEDAREELDEAKAQLEEARTQLIAAMTQLAQTQAQSEEEQEQLDAQQAQLDAQDAELTAAEEALAQQEAELSAQEEALAQQDAELTEQEETFAAQEAEFEAQKAEAQAQFASAWEEIEENQAQLDEALEQLAEARAQLEASAAELEESEALLDEQEEAAKEQFADAWAEIEENKQELIDAQAQLEDALAELEDGEVQYEEGLAELTDGISTYESERADAEKELSDAQDEVNDIDDAVWYVQDRTSLSGYANIDSDSGAIEAIGNVFPILFLAVAVLISLTTITRMVDEERGLLGTYKALGFSDREVLFKYMIFSVSAALAGSLIGMLAGFIALPEIVFIIFRTMYSLPAFHLSFDPVYGLLGPAIFLVGIGAATFLACRSSLKQAPAILMRPKAPAAGSKVILEKIPFLWKRLSFLNKVTARNLFRYKKRLFMTVAGILGCTALLVCGFAIKDTVTDLMPKQYEQVYRYDLLAVGDDNDKLLEYMDTADEVESYLNIRIDNVTVEYEGTTMNVQLIVVPDDQLDAFSAYITLADTDENELTLHEDSVLITRNVGQILGFSDGDTVFLQDLTLTQAQVQVTNLVQNYLGNNVYMTQSVYEELFGDYEANGVLAMLSDDCDDPVAWAKSLSRKDSMTSATATQQLMDEFSTAFALINMVVYIIIFMAAALAFVVLFTLSTTNISERERELATIKVLGFLNREVHLYVNKETLILTILGILPGLLVGTWLGHAMTMVLNMPSLYFDVSIFPVSYLYSGGLTILFALLVQVITNRTLDQINPAEALKSIE